MTTWTEYEDTCFITSKRSWKKNTASFTVMRKRVRLLSNCSVQLTKYNTERYFTTIRSSFNQQYLSQSELKKNNTRISDFKAKLASQPSIKKNNPTSASFRKCKIKYKWENKCIYSLIFFPGFCFDFSGNKYEQYV